MSSCTDWVNTLHTLHSSWTSANTTYILKAIMYKSTRKTSFISKVNHFNYRTWRDILTNYKAPPNKLLIHIYSQAPSMPNWKKASQYKKKTEIQYHSINNVINSWTNMSSFIAISSHSCDGMYNKLIRNLRATIIVFGIWRIKAKGLLTIQGQDSVKGSQDNYRYKPKRL